ncbi:MAG: hypothetical protein EBZ48_07075 [Proteobacteria bacterium]|nr:hypothetical protein [Pseudomonadota bacterium]
MSGCCYTCCAALKLIHRRARRNRRGNEGEKPLCFEFFGTLVNYERTHEGFSFAATLRHIRERIEISREQFIERWGGVFNDLAKEQEDLREFTMQEVAARFSVQLGGRP